MLQKLRCNVKVLRDWKKAGPATTGGDGIDFPPVPDPRGGIRIELTWIMKHDRIGRLHEII
jgi:hypothetical protein